MKKKINLSLRICTYHSMTSSSPHFTHATQARKWRPRRPMGLWHCPTRRANDRASQQLDQGLGPAIDVGNERLWARRHLSVLYLNKAHVELVDQGRPSVTPVVTQVGTPAERVRAGDRQARVAGWPGQQRPRDTRAGAVRRRRVHDDVSQGRQRCRAEARHGG